MRKCKELVIKKLELSHNKTIKKIMKLNTNHLSEVWAEPFVAPTPALPCLVGLYVNENSPKYLPIISNLISTGLNTLPLYTPTMLPTISGITIQFLKWVLTVAGFSPGWQFFLAFLHLL